jgi:hypothetical protein
MRTSTPVGLALTSIAGVMSGNGLLPPNSFEHGSGKMFGQYLVSSLSSSTYLCHGTEAGPRLRMGIGFA